MKAPEKRKRNRLARLGKIMVTLLVAFVLVSWFFAYDLTRARHRAVPRPADFPFAMTDASWTTSDGQTIKGWFVPGEQTQAAVLLLHGFRGDRRSMLARARLFREAGYGVLLYDARGCGESTGDFTTLGFHETHDLEGGLDFLRGTGARHIACLGVSQGAATILLAAERLQDVDCVVCESSFDELAHAVDHRFRRYLLTPGWLAGCLMLPIAEYRTGVAVEQVKPIGATPKLPCAAFIIGGANDVKTLPSETVRLFESAPEPKQLWLVPNKGHQDLFSQEYAEKVLAFLKMYLKPKAF